MGASSIYVNKLYTVMCIYCMYCSNWNLFCKVNDISADNCKAGDLALHVVITATLCHLGVTVVGVCIVHIILVMWELTGT